MSMKNWICACAVLASTTLFFAPATASATLLSDLLVPGATLTVGDLQFGGFSYLDTGDMPGANAVNVVPYTDAAGEVGLKFQGAFIDFTPGSGSDALIGFTAADLVPGGLITDATLTGNPAVLGGAGVASVTESFLPTDTNTTLTIFAISPGTSQLSDSGDFAVGHTSVIVQKDILAFSAQVGGGVPTLSFITQTFSTTNPPIPEPSSVVLLGVGLLSLVCLRRRLK